MTDSIAAQVAALPKKPTPELKQIWRELFDKEPPGFSRNYLISRLAYRIQELAYGGLKPATRAKLDALADGLDPKAARKRIVNGPVVGTRLVREFQGREYTVTVLNDGFEWEGRRYKRLDGTTLVVRIPMRFQRRGGRKRIVAPDGTAITPTANPQTNGTLVKAVARAWRWQRMLDEGLYTSVSEISEADNIGKSYVSRILRLALLAPSIVEEILDRRADHALMLNQLERPIPVSWEEQQRLVSTASM